MGTGSIRHHEDSQVNELMNMEDALKVAESIQMADGGCSYCVDDICEELNKRFPEFEWFADDKADPIDLGVWPVKVRIRE